LLRERDERHVFAESYRNVRSSLAFMEMDGVRPKTLLITSAIPSEGKSTVAANLAVTMAFSGSKVLLIDGDMRRGALHDAFGVPNDLGLSDVLSRRVAYEPLIYPTAYANLFLLPRGKTPANPGELYLSKTTDELIKSIYMKYDTIIFDSAPVLATDDTTSLAPKIEGVLFVIRASHTSARLSRNSLDNLYQRQVNVLGLIFNGVDTSLPEYYHYQYKDYYGAPAKAVGSA
jgi:polysaccharide biosynthesis transport protein